MDASLTAPLGLGWARKLAEAATAHEDHSEQEIFVRTLGVGILAAGTGVYLASAAAVYFVAPLAFWPFLGGGLLMAVLLYAVLARPSSFALSLNIAFGIVEAIAIFVTVLQGGLVASGANMIWALAPPVVAMVLFGARNAMGWLAVFVVGVAGLAAAPYLDVGFPDPAVPDPLPVLVMNLVFFGVFTIVCLSWFVQQRRIAEAATERERARSEALLLNVLPEEIAVRLKDGIRIADQFDEASVLFADLVGFTPLSASLSAAEVVQMLHDLFAEFDALVEDYGVEKIKTIGDCYMIASGVPVPREDHAQAMASLAIELRDVVERREFKGHDIQIRIGIHSGPLVAGVIGESRFLYDLWGDTVNLASRMESSGVPGRIHVSEATAERLGDAFDVEERGLVKVKGKGEQRTFFVRGPAPRVTGEE